MVEYVVDTCAAIEYLKANKKFVDKINSATKLHTTLHMLTELYFNSLKNNGEGMANRHFEAFARYFDVTTENEIKEAMKLRLEMKKQGAKASYADAISYQKAVEKKCKFLTGDGAFKNFENSEFIPTN